MPKIIRAEIEADINDETVTRGSGNVFADVSVENPEEALLKAQVVSAIRSLIDAKELSQTAAAELVGVRQPDLSKLLRGRSAGFSLARLFDIVTALGSDVEIEIKRTADNRNGRIHIREAA